MAHTSAPGKTTSLCESPSIRLLEGLAKASFWDIEHSLKVHAKNEGHGYTNMRGRPCGKNGGFYFLCASFGEHQLRRYNSKYKTGCQHKLYFKNISKKGKVMDDCAGPFKVDWGKSHLEHNHGPFEVFRGKVVPSIEERKMGMKVKMNRGKGKKIKSKDIWGEEEDEEDDWDESDLSEEEEEDFCKSDVSEEEEDELESDVDEEVENESESEYQDEEEEEEKFESHQHRSTQDQAAPSPIHLTDQVNIQHPPIAEEPQSNPNEEMLRLQERIESLQNRLNKAEVKRDDVERRNRDLQDRVDEMHEERQIEVERRKLEEAKCKLDEREKKLSERKRKWGEERGRAGEKRVKIEYMVVDDDE